MIMTKLAPFLSLSILSIALQGCGLDFGVGGASIEGTGNGQPPAPGMGNAGGGGRYNLFLSAEAEDTCAHIQRQLRFKYPNQDGFVEYDEQVLVTMGEDKFIPLNLNLTLTNLNHHPVTLKYPSCDDPLQFSNLDTQQILFPSQQCDLLTTQTLEHGESTTFKMTYPLTQELNGAWHISPDMKFIVSGQHAEQCEEMELVMQLRKHKAEINK